MSPVQFVFQERLKSRLIVRPKESPAVRGCRHDWSRGPKVGGSNPAPATRTAHKRPFFIALEQNGRGVPRRNAVNPPPTVTEKVVYIEHTAHTHDSTYEGRRQSLAEIRIFDGESIESALRRFKRQVQQEGIIKEVKKHAFFLKPGERKRLKSKLAQKLKRKKVRRSPADSDSKAPSRSQ